MEDFYQSLKDNLDNRPEPDFKEGAWDDLEGRLDALQKKDGRVVVWPWWSYAALALLPLSILLNAWLFLRQGDKVTMEEESGIVESLLVDTVYQTRIVYQSDTVYRTKVMQQERSASDYAYYWKANAEREIAKWEEKFMPQLVGEERGVDNGSISALLTNLSGNPLQQLMRKAGIDENFLLTEKESLGEQPLSELDGIEFLLNESKASESLAVLPLDIPSFTTSPIPLWEKILPESFSLGVELGAYHPFIKGGEDENALYRGIELAIQLPNRLEIWGQGGLLQMNYKFDEMGDEFGIPILQAPSGDYEFNYVKVRQERLHYGAGLQYSFTSQGSRWRPTVGLGYAAMAFLPYELYYEFEDKNTDTEIKLEEHIKRDDGPYQYAVARAGLRLPFNKRWQWRMLAEFRYSLSDDRFTNPHLLGLTGGLSYQF